MDSNAYSSSVGPLEYNSNLSYYNQNPNYNNSTEQSSLNQQASYPTASALNYGQASSSSTSYSQYSGQMSSDWSFPQASSLPFDSTINSNGLLSNDFSDEPPLLEELGINPKDIIRKTLAVSIPFRKIPQLTEQETDLSGVRETKATL